MATLESSPWIRRLQPTAGTTMTLDAVRLTVMGPGVGLRNRFDTYGVEINDSSITIIVEYPANQLFAQRAGSRINRRAAPQPSRRLLLGADAQFTSWAQTTVDFPDLQQSQNVTLAKELRAARGKDYLTADLIKISHHASKHGVNLELLERTGAPISLVSSVAGGGKYGFPHLLAKFYTTSERLAINQLLEGEADRRRSGSVEAGPVPRGEQAAANRAQAVANAYRIRDDIQATNFFQAQDDQTFGGDRIHCVRSSVFGCPQANDACAHRGPAAGGGEDVNGRLPRPSGYQAGTIASARR
jgi:hypothetical protein